MSKKKKDSDEPKKMKNKAYLKELRKLQERLCQLQDWVKFKGLRVIIVFEGRDAAGKGGTIRALTETSQSSRFSFGGTTGTVRPREVSTLHTALHSAFPGQRRDRDF